VGDQFGPSVAVAPGGGFVVAWEGAPDGDFRGVAARRFDAAGVPLGPEFQVNTFTQSFQDGPDVAVDASGSFAVVWHSPQDGSSAGAYARLYDGSGVAQTGEIQVNTYTSGFQGVPTVAMTPGGGFVVAFFSEGADGSDSGIFARRFDSTGTPLGAEVQVNQYTTGHQHWPSIGSDASARFVISWINNDGQDGDGPGIFARRFDAAGVALGGEFQVNTYTTGSQYQSTVAVGPAGQFAVAWQSEGQDGSGRGIFVRRFDAAGAPIGAENGANTTTDGDQRQPTVAASTGSYATVWESTGQDGSGGGIFGRLEPTCGNGMTDPGEFCDDGNLTNGDGCESTCTPTGCGNGSVGGSEDCDDGNVTSGDCCSGGCTFEAAASACTTTGGCSAGQCDGTGTCVASPLPAGTACAGDGSSCTRDECNGAGLCTHPAALAGTRCESDGNSCTTDACDGAGACTHDATPQTGCRLPTVSGRGTLNITAGRAFTWRWVRGQAIDAGLFGDPYIPNGTSYRVCIYDASASPQPRVDAFTPAGGTCKVGRPCWLPSGTKGGADYANFLTDSPPDGVSQIRLKPGPEGRGKMLVRGRGPLVAPGYLPFTPPVVAQLVADSGACWEATYSSTLVNVPDHFKARVD
jgi:cysteine-rich repeat protein